MTYKEQRELEALPQRIEALEAELEQMHQRMAEPAFYREAPAEIVRVKSRLQAIQEELAEVYRRWEELESPGSL